jgi:hypothetical protein
MFVGYITARRFFRDDWLAMVAALIVALADVRIRGCRSTRTSGLAPFLYSYTW